MWLSMCTLTYIFLSKTNNFAISVIKIHGRHQHRNPNHKILMFNWTSILERQCWIWEFSIWINNTSRSTRLLEFGNMFYPNFQTAYLDRHVRYNSGTRRITRYMVPLQHTFCVWCVYHNNHRSLYRDPTPPSLTNGALKKKKEATLHT